MKIALLAAAVLLSLALPASAQPLRIILLVDTSGSAVRGPLFFSRLSPLNGMDLTYMTESVTALETALQADDQVFVGVVGEQPQMTTDPLRGASLMRAAQQLAEQFGGRSPLWDSLYYVCDRIERSAGTPIVILITDGRSNGNEHSFAEALQRLKAARVRVFPVTRLEVHHSPDPDPADRLRDLASGTGGQHLTFTPGKLSDAIAIAVQSARRNPR